VRIEKCRGILQFIQFALKYGNIHETSLPKQFSPIFFSLNHHPIMGSLPLECC
jgi:hypothetical protein